MDAKDKPFVEQNISCAFNSLAIPTRLAQRDSTFYPLRYDDRFPKTYTFTAQNQDSVSADVKLLWDNMQTLKNSETIIGPALAQLSQEVNVLFCYDTLRGPYALWIKEEGIVHMDFETPTNLQMVVQAHELIHAAQYHNNLYDSDLDKSIYALQLRQLSHEAAAMVGGYLLAIEMAEHGVRGPWQEVLQMDPHAQELMATWDSLKTSGLSYEQALSKTGEIAFLWQFKRSEWLETYNNHYLYYYLSLTAQGDMLPLMESEYPLAKLQKTGHISPSFNYTASIRSLPEKDSLFGNDPRMRYAFDCADLWHVQKTAGTDNDLYQKMYKRMKEVDLNPYVDLDMNEVLKTYSRGGVMSLLEIMDSKIKTKENHENTFPKPRPGFLLP